MEDLPARLEIAWGLRERPGKGPKPGLSLARIVAAAVALADRDGLAAISMNKVAAELDTAGMSLYRYVGSKDDLVDLMVDEAYGPPPSLPAPGEDWRQGLAHWARDLTAVQHAHPWVAQVTFGGPPLMPNRVRWFEQGLRCLAGTTLREDEKVLVILLVSALVGTQSIMEQQLAAAVEAQGGVIGPDYGTMLARLTDPRDFPAIRAVIDSGLFDQEDDQDLGFDFGMELFYDGIATYMAQRPS